MLNYNLPLTEAEAEFAAEHYSIIHRYLRMAGLPENDFYDVVVFGYLRAVRKYLARPELQKLLAFVRTGDCVIVESISRFARNTRDLLELIERLQSKQVQFVSKKEAIDTTTPTGKFMLTVFGAVAELEREYILQRQREGIAIAKENGVYKGRKPIVCAGFDSVLMLWCRREITAVEAQKRLGLSPSTFYRKVREYEKQIGKEEET